jgi:hypothetical protein
VLVAVGADYNMLLICGIRDESSQRGIPSGVIRTVASTGGVITSAGVIFAASMFGLLFGSVTGMVQAGSIIGAGLLLDTFLVRTITVPALAVLVGRANWWPILWGRPRAREPIQPVEPTPKDQETMPEASVAVRTPTTPANPQTPAMHRLGQPRTPNTKAQVAAVSTSAGPQSVPAQRVPISTPAHPEPPQTVQDPAQTDTMPVDAGFASELVDTGATTQSVETVIAVLTARLDGASINAAAKAAGINYRSAQRIVEAAAEHRQRQLVAVG